MPSTRERQAHWVSVVLCLTVQTTEQMHLSLKVACTAQELGEACLQEGDLITAREHLEKSLCMSRAKPSEDMHTISAKSLHLLASWAILLHSHTNGLNPAQSTRPLGQLPWPLLSYSHTIVLNPKNIYYILKYILTFMYIYIYNKDRIVQSLY